MNRATVFDCFCGLGGLSLGAELAGFDVVGGIDVDEAAIDAYARSFPGALLIRSDLLREKPRAMLRKAGLASGDVEVLVSGPPCQPYSSINPQRGTHDPRCTLIKRFLDFVSILRPRWIVAENVPGFATIDRGKFLESLLRALRRREYAVEHLLVDVSRFGVPQRRKRLIILAAKDQEKLLKVVGELSALHAQIVTVGEAFFDLPVETAEIAAYREAPANAFQRLMRRRGPRAAQCHVCSQLGPLNLARIKCVPPGGNWRNIPRCLLPAGMKDMRLSGYTTRYGRLRFDRPSFTVLTSCNPHDGCYVYPTENRIITVREAARLQSIPDHVEFHASLTANYRLVGNAVPPLLAKSILERLL